MATENLPAVKRQARSLTSNGPCIQRLSSTSAVFSTSCCSCGNDCKPACPLLVPHSGKAHYSRHWFITRRMAEMQTVCKTAMQRAWNICVSWCTPAGGTDSRPLLAYIAMCGSQARPGMCMIKALALRIFSGLKAGFIILR